MKDSHNDSEEHAPKANQDLLAYVREGEDDALPTSDTELPTQAHETGKVKINNKDRQKAIAEQGGAGCCAVHLAGVPAD